MNFSYRDLILPPSATLLEAMKKIDSLASQIALIARKDDFLLGTLTDGDIRRALLNGEKLEASCEIAMNKSFLSFSLESGYASMQRIMKEKKIRHVPIVDGDGRVVSIVSLEEFEESNLIDTSFPKSTSASTTNDSLLWFVSNFALLVSMSMSTHRLLK